MFGMMKGKRVNVSGSQMYDLKLMVDSSVRKSYTDVGAIAAKDKKSVTVMLWNYHDDDLQSEAINTEIVLNGLPKDLITFTHYRIDNEHSNSYEAWKKMGSPQNPTAKQIEELEKEGQLETMGPQRTLKATKGKLLISVSMPRQAVSLIKLSW